MLFCDREEVCARRTPACFALILVAAIAALGQGPTRSFEVSGVVLDPSGAVIADAKIILRWDGGRSAETKTSNQNAASSGIVG